MPVAEVEAMAVSFLRVFFVRGHGLIGGIGNPSGGYGGQGGYGQGGAPAGQGGYGGQQGGYGGGGGFAAYPQQGWHYPYPYLAIGLFK